jgi:hypothetical protein
MSAISFTLLPLYRWERAVCTNSVGGGWTHKAGLGGVVNNKIPVAESTILNISFKCPHMIAVLVS